MKKHLSEQETLYPKERLAINGPIIITLAIEIGINSITNCVLNAVCAWLLNQNAVTVAINSVSIIIDLSITCLFICLCTTPFAALSAKRYRKSGILKEWNPKMKLLTRYPKKTVFLALSLTGSAIVPLGIILCIGFSVLKITELTVFSYTLYKGALGGIIGGWVCFLTLARYQF